jgi:hypothetical protein
LRIERGRMIPLSGCNDDRQTEDATKEVKKVSGLSFSGEVVDVTGDLGGYNLHWAWASGFRGGAVCVNRENRWTRIYADRVRYIRSVCP